MPTDVFDAFAGVVDKPVRFAGELRDDFWNKSPPVMKDGVLVRGGFLAPQLAAWNLPNFIKILVGGYGAGKTIWTCKRAISTSIQNAPAPTAIVSPTFPLARKTVVPTLDALLAGKQSIYGRQFWWRRNKSTMEYRIRFRGRNATIHIQSGEDPLSLRGPNLGSVYIDEPFIQDIEVFQQMVFRTRHPEATLREVALTGTPEQLNWGYDLAVGEMKDQQDVGVVTASTRENIVLGQTYVQQLESILTGKAAEAFIEGQFVQLSTGLVFYGFQGANSPNVKRLPIPPGAELGCGMDFNVDPMAFNVFWRKGNHMHFFHEYELPNADTEYACDVLREKYVERGDDRLVPDQFTLRKIYPDATGYHRETSQYQGRSDFWYIRNAGFEIDAPHDLPGLRDSENSVNGKLNPKVGETTLTIDPDCKNLIKYLSTYSHELKKKQKKMKHLLDAFRYPVHRLFPITHERLHVTPILGV